jgi:aspartyl-tRNA(Asn)/glutamyl-tRNA(Gln) amidotransferase subunit A
VTDPANLGLTQASEAIAAGALSPLELTNACLARARRLEDRLQAFTHIDESGARQQAEAATAELARGTRVGPLHGIPIAIKDLIDVAGLPTTASSRVLAGNVATTDATVVTRLRAGGAVLIGKTNTQEFAYGVVTAPTRNPWDTARIPGGSSGGSAVAVAGGMALGALGSDTAGSIRIPSALCGISGLKPRQSSLPMDGIIPLSWTLDSGGPMARSVEDLELMWRVLTGSQSETAPLASLRIATPEWDSLGDADAEVIDAVEGAIAVLGRTGARRAPVTLPPFELWDRPRNIVIATEALTAHREAGWYPDRADDYGPELVRSLKWAESITGEQLVSARRTLAGLARVWLSALEDADILALPTTPIPAPRSDEVAAMRGESFRPEVVIKLTRLCGPVNWCDLAAASIPCGFTREGLPIGLQLVARQESTVLSAAHSYQSRTDFHTRRPPLEA